MGQDYHDFDPTGRSQRANEIMIGLFEHGAEALVVEARIKVKPP